MSARYAFEHCPKRHRHAIKCMLILAMLANLSTVYWVDIIKAYYPNPYNLLLTILLG